jgi:hypothetical protein
MADGGWRMADGGWRMADGGWRMADGGWRMDGWTDGRNTVLKPDVAWFSQGNAAVAHERYGLIVLF